MLQWLGIIFLVALSALFAGLTLGIMSLDITGLEVVIASGTPKESEYARKIYPVRSRGNLLLCTLLMGNVSVNSLLSILMADFTSGLVGFLLSTAIIVVLGEIVPQAACSRHGLAVGAHTLYIVYFFLILFFPFTYPISYFLDLALGREVATIYSKKELKKLLDIHAIHQESGVSRRDAVILSGVLDFAQKKLDQIMTPLDKVFMLDIEQRLDYATLTSIMDNGHSRVPVYEGERNNIINCLHMKDLALVNPEEGVSLRSFLSFYGRQIPKIRADRTLDYVLTEFKSGKSHIAIVQGEGGASANDDNIGIATLEDVLEEILQDDILDEDDVVGVPLTKRGSFRDVLLKSAAQINPHQLKAIYAFLSSSVPEFSANILSEDSFKYLISKAEVLLLDKANKAEPHIYERGVKTSYFTLILQGKIEILSGQEGFRSECGPFSFLGITALKNDNFIPDFTAKVLVNAQVLRIRKKQYEEAVRMNTTISLTVPTTNRNRGLSPSRRPEPKSFMESTDFVELRAKPVEKEGAAARLLRAKAKPLTIALKDLAAPVKKNKKDAKEEKEGLIDTSLSSADESGNISPGDDVAEPFSAYRTDAAQAVLSAFNGGEGSSSGSSSQV